MKQRVRGLIAVLLGLALAFGAASLAQAQDDPKAPPKDLVLRDDAKCTRCHDHEEEYPVLSIGKTRHGVRADGRTPTCTSCHGESAEHLKKVPGQRPAKPDRTFGGQLEAIPSSDDRVDRYFGIFGKKTATPVEDRNAACLACHQGDKRIHWQAGAHAGNGVACTNCHQIHVQHDRARDKQTQTELCFSCHKEQRAQINRPSRHPIKEGKVVCSDCHNPHGTAGPKMLVRDSVNATCYQCHAEKRGPFVRTHQPVQEDCSICHNPHGTTNDNLLKLRAPFLCQQCHEPTSHRGNVGQFTGPLNTPGGSTSANLLARGCLNCHTNIHGTNNPANISNERTFRR